MIEKKERNFDIPLEKRLTIGNMIKEHREHKKYGLNEFSTKCGVNASDLHKIENGTKLKINPLHLKTIAENLDVDYLIFYIVVGFIDEEVALKMGYDKTIISEKENPNKWLNKVYIPKIDSEEELSEEEKEELRKFYEFLKFSKDKG